MRKIWSEGFQILPAVIQRAWIWLIPSMIIEELFNVWLKSMSQNKDEIIVILCVLWAVILQLVLSSILIIIVNQVVYDIKVGRKDSALIGVKKNIKFVLIEMTRALLPIILKFLLFVIPGVIEFIRLYFVGYIAQFNSAYRAGEIDALDYSRKLVRGKFFIVTGLLILSTILSMFPRLYLESIDVFKQPAFYVIVFLVSLVADVYGDILLFLTYEKLEERAGHAISLS